MDYACIPGTQMNQMTYFWRSAPQIKAFLNQNKGHLSSGYIDDTIVPVFQLPYKPTRRCGKFRCAKSRRCLKLDLRISQKIGESILNI